MNSSNTVDTTFPRREVRAFLGAEGHACVGSARVQKKRAIVELCLSPDRAKPDRSTEQPVIGCSSPTTVQSNLTRSMSIFAASDEEKSSHGCFSTIESFNDSATRTT